jgi:CO dehydrogenase nickel-insertion accessory protein CooC1
LIRHREIIAGEFPVKNENHLLAGKRIGVFGKGGAGKSTFVVSMAKALRYQGYEVCVLDADSTNVGLSQALGVAAPQKTLLDYYGGMIFSGGLVTCPVDDPTPLAGAEIDLDRLPPQYYARNEQGITILIAGKIGEHGPGAGCDGPVAKIARDITIHRTNQEPVTLIDFKAGFEDSARGAITSLDWAFVVVDPTIASVEIAANMRNMVEQIKAHVLPATAHLESPELVTWAHKIFTEARIKDVFFVLNSIRDREIESYLFEKLAQRGIEPIGTIHQDPAVPAAWLKGRTVQSAQILTEVTGIVDQLEGVIHGGS